MQSPRLKMCLLSYGQAEESRQEGTYHFRIQKADEQLSCDFTACYTSSKWTSHPAVQQFYIRHGWV